MMFVRNSWYAAAWMGEVGQRQPLARAVIGESLVLFCEPDGAVTALEDRCAHRSMSLSAVLLAGAVAAAVAAAMLRFAPADGPRIASVRLGEMTAAYAVKAAGENAAAAAVASEVLTAEE